MRWKLTCFYMGRAASRTVTDAELQDRWTLVETGEDVGKCAGREFEDDDGPKGFDEYPLTWKYGKATETGCGPWEGICENAHALALSHDDTVQVCDGLLVRAGLPRLTVVAGNLDATFDVEGVNAELLGVLDRAEWGVVVVDDV